MPHLFLFTQENEAIWLTSYEIPSGYDKTTFTYAQLESIDYANLKRSEKFTLFERFSEEKLEVSEIMEVNGKRTLGYDEPIIYKRKL